MKLKVRENITDELNNICSYMHVAQCSFMHVVRAIQKLMNDDFIVVPSTLRDIIVCSGKT